MERLGPDRLRLDLPEQAGVALEHAVEWLSRQPEVRRVIPRRTGLELVVSRPGPALWLRWRDWLFRSTQRPPAVWSVELLHEVEGRARFRLRGAEQLAPRAAAWLRSLPGIVRAEGSPATGGVLVYFDPQRQSPASIESALLKSAPAEWPAAESARRHPWTGAALSGAVLGACLTQVIPAPALAAGVVLTALPTLRRAGRAVGEGRVTVDLLDVAAIGISMGTGRLGTAAFITTLLSVADGLLEQTAGVARSVIGKLVNLESKDALLLREEGDTKRVPAKGLKAGQRVLVPTGERVPADGVVLSGDAWLDEKALTGESAPKEVTRGGRVLAASVVASGELVVEVQRGGSDTAAAQIIRTLEAVGRKPMLLQRQVEALADGLVLPTFGLAALAGGLSAQLERATSILITDFGTGIRIATPTHALVGMTLALRQGLLIKGGQYLERLARTDVIVFDKTGTLTEGELEVVDFEAVNGADAREALRLAAAAEAHASHPVARAVCRAAERPGSAPRDRRARSRWCRGAGCARGSRATRFGSGMSASSRKPESGSARRGRV